MTRHFFRTARRIGGSIVVAIPRPIARHHRIAPGSTLHIVRTEHSIIITPPQHITFFNNTEEHPHEKRNAK